MSLEDNKEREHADRPADDRAIDYRAVRRAIPLSWVLELLECHPTRCRGSKLRGHCDLYSRAKPERSKNKTQICFRCRPVARCLVLLRMPSRWRSTDTMVAGQSQATVRRHKIAVPINRPPHSLAHLTTAPPMPLTNSSLLTQKTPPGNQPADTILTRILAH